METAHQAAETQSTSQPKLGLLTDPSQLWFVRTGAVDLFLVRVENNRPSGARRPVTRIGTGEVLFGLPAAAHGFTLLAQATPGTRVEAAAARSSTSEDLARWIERLAAPLAAVPPGGLSSLDTGEHVEIRPGGAAGVTSGLVWVAHSAGASRLLGISGSEPVNGFGAFPVTSSSWLVADEGARLRRVDPPADAMFDGLAAFHRRILAAHVERTREQESRFSARLQDRVQSDRNRVETAHRALAGVLEGTAASHAPATGDPLFEATAAVGQALGIKIVPAAAPRPGSLSRNPIENIARASSVHIRRVSLSRNWWRQDSGPFVGYFGDARQPVALLPKGPREYEMWDPASRARQRVTAALAKQIYHQTYSLYRPFPAEKLGAVQLLKFGLRGLGRDVSLIAISGVLTGLLALVTPIASGILFDTIIPATDRRQLVQMFGILIAAAISTWLLGLVQSFALLRIESRMDAGLQAALWDRLLSLPVTFFRGYTAGDLAIRSLSISTMRQALTGTALSAMLASVFSVFSLGLLYSYGVQYALPATGLIVLSFLVTVLAAAGQVRIQRKLAELGGKVAGLLPQLLGGIGKLRVAGAEDRAFVRWAVRFAEQKRLSVRARRLSIALSIFFPLFQAITTMLLFTFLARPNSSMGSGSEASGGFTTGAFLAFQAAFFQVLGGASQLGSALVSMLGVVPLWERAKPILEALPEVNRNQSDPGTLTGDIELSHLAFRYRADLPPVLKDVSLRIRAGQFAAIVGGTGSGKSTLFRLMLGFEEPESGSIFYDGQDLAGLDVQAVRRQVGVVLQQNSALGGDLFSNIVGSSPLTLDDAWEAARMAGLEEDIRNMPMGMHTLIPEGGLGLSGGQRQRLAIARSIVNRPRLILFDEATSALDNQTQAVVMESLSRLKATRIVIAHRLSTIRNADCIFVLNQGVIEESGTYDELLAKNGFFTELARRQLA